MVKAVPSEEQHQRFHIAEAEGSGREEIDFTKIQPTTKQRADNNNELLILLQCIINFFFLSLGETVTQRKKACNAYEDDQMSDLTETSR